MQEDRRARIFVYYATGTIYLLDCGQPDVALRHHAERVDSSQFWGRTVGADPVDEVAEAGLAYGRWAVMNRRFH